MPTLQHLAEPLAATWRTYGPRLAGAEVGALSGAGTAVLTWEGAVPCVATAALPRDPMLADVWDGRVTLRELDVTRLTLARTGHLTVEERR